MTMHANMRRTLAIIACVLLAACGQTELYSKLSESQANEMIAVLQTAGIDASKTEVAEKGWTLATAQGDFAQAVKILHTQGYPREEFASLGTVFKKEGFVSSPTEERARLQWGLSQELSRTVSEIDGVVQARVHVALADDDRLGDRKRPASAAVFIKYRPGANMDAQVGKVKAMVVNAVEGLSYEKVSVSTFPAQPLPIAARAPADNMVRGSIAALAVPIVLLVAAFFGYPGFRRWQQRRRIAAALPPVER